MRFEELRSRAAAFGDRLDRIKAEHPDPPWWGWYPFRMLPNFVEQLDQLLTGDNRRLLEDPTDRRIADIGTADGDFGFFLESVGFEVDLFDGGGEAVRDLRLLPPRLLKEALGSKAEIHSIDLDHDFDLPRTYTLSFMLGVLYHLKNPFLALETLSRSTRYLILSTKVADRLPRGSGRALRAPVRVAKTPLAYLLDPDELGVPDTSNYWVFSEMGLRRLLQRSGWDTLDLVIAGNPKAEPASPTEARAWCLARSQNVTG